MREAIREIVTATSILSETHTLTASQTITVTSFMVAPAGVEYRTVTITQQQGSMDLTLLIITLAIITIMILLTFLRRRAEREVR